MFKGTKKLLITSGVLVGGGYLVYRFGLSDTAKNWIKFGYNAIKETYAVISNTLDQALGIAVDDEEIENIQLATEKQWEEIGF